MIAGATKSFARHDGIENPGRALDILLPGVKENKLCPNWL